MQSKKIQAQLKELRYGKKDLIFKVSTNRRWVVLLCLQTSGKQQLLATVKEWYHHRQCYNYFSQQLQSRLQQDTSLQSHLDIA